MLKCVTKFFYFLCDVEASERNLLWIVDEDGLLKVEPLQVGGRNADHLD